MPDSLQGEDWRSVAGTKQPEGDILQIRASERGRGRAVADEIGVHHSTVARALKALMTYGFIEIQDMATFRANVPLRRID